MAELSRDTQQGASKTGERRNKQALRALILPMRKDATPDLTPNEMATPADEPGWSKAVSEDPFQELGLQGNVLLPPFDLFTLAMLPEHNSELTPVIETMETNIDGFGHHLVPRVDVHSADLVPEIQTEVKREKVKLTNFFNYANLRDSFTMLRRKLRKDIETTGNAYWEVIRSVSGKIQGFEHVPSYQVRLGKIDIDPIEVEIPTLQLQEDDSVRIEPIKTWQRFRPFVQARLSPTYGFGGGSGGYVTSGGYRMRWFKEFGDPRVYDNETGEVVPPEKVADFKDGKPMEYARRANELIHFKLYSTRSPYGLPRYIGNLLSIFGTRAAEEINYVTFRNNNIPSMAILVSNGQLTQDTVERITSFIESKIQGSDNYSKFLVIEAEGIMEGEDAGQIKMEMKPLVEAQHKDALFQNYMKNGQNNVRRAFRIPPIFVGMSEEYTRATADTSRMLADEQVFAPERDEFDLFMNRRLFPDMGIIYHKFKSNSPNTTDNTELVSILSGAEKTGGMTPRIARIVLEDILGQELPPFTQSAKFDPDLPFSLLMAEAVKNVGMPNEPGQQLTALKSLGYWTEKDGDQGPSVETVVTKHLVELRKRLEREWQKQVFES